MGPPEFTIPNATSCGIGETDRGPQCIIAAAIAFPMKQ